MVKTRKSKKTDLVFMNGKGDTPRNNYSRRFRDNYDDIAWGFVECSKCGQTYINKHKETFMVYVNKKWECKKCNQT